MTVQDLRIEIPHDVRDRLAAAADLQAAAGDGVVVPMSGILISGVDAIAFEEAVQCVLSAKGFDNYKLNSRHLLALERLDAGPVIVHDSVGSNTAISVIMCLSGAGEISLSMSTGSKHTQKMDKQSLMQGIGILFSGNTVYSFRRSRIICSHYVYSLDTFHPAVAIFQAVVFPCPYNVKERPGDFRVYPRNFVESSSAACEYRGTRWKNVLDHLVFCKSNPRRNECQEKHNKRKIMNKVEVACDLCSHPPFRSRNSLVKHKLRKHPRLEIESGLSQGMVACVSEAINDAQTLSLTPLERTPEPDLMKRLHKRKQVQKRHLLEEFNLCMSADENLTPYSNALAIKIVDELLNSVSRSDVRQPSGKTEYNAGEVTPAGVTKLLDAFGDVDTNDVFGDIGAGVGNIIIQAALQSRFRWCVGVEMRTELTTIIKDIVSSQAAVEPRLAKVKVVEADISQVDTSKFAELADVTHLFSHNTLFTASANFALEELCWLPRLRVLAISRPFCGRHSMRCEKSFCRFWTLVKTIKVGVTYTDSLVNVFLYRKSEEVQI